MQWHVEADAKCCDNVCWGDNVCLRREDKRTERQLDEVVAGERVVAGHGRSFGCGDDRDWDSAGSETGGRVFHRSWQGQRRLQGCCHFSVMLQMHCENEYTRCM